MFKDSGSYQPRGKKCDGFSSLFSINLDKSKPTINLSWGMDALDSVKIDDQKLPPQSSTREK